MFSAVQVIVEAHTIDIVGISRLIDQIPYNMISLHFFVMNLLSQQERRHEILIGRGQIHQLRNKVALCLVFAALDNFYMTLQAAAIGLCNRQYNRQSQSTYATFTTVL